jgi:hypothetical protein
MSTVQDIHTSSMLAGTWGIFGYRFGSFSSRYAY